MKAVELANFLVHHPKDPTWDLESTLIWRFFAREHVAPEMSDQEWESFVYWFESIWEVESESLVHGYLRRWRAK